VSKVWTDPFTSRPLHDSFTTNGEQGASAYAYNSNGLLAHAVKQVGSKKYAYDLCGNMVFRNGQALGYDVENRLASVTKNGMATGKGVGKGSVLNIDTNRGFEVR